MRLPYTRLTVFSLCTPLTKGRGRERRRGRGRLGKERTKEEPGNENGRACCSNADPIDRSLSYKRYPQSWVPVLRFPNRPRPRRRSRPRPPCITAKAPTRERVHVAILLSSIPHWDATAFSLCTLRTQGRGRGRLGKERTKEEPR